MNQIEYIVSVILFLWLLLCSIQDIKKKKINVYLILAGLLMPLIGIIWNGEFNYLHSLEGMSLGLILLCISFITKGQIGVGDGMIVCITGLCLGFSGNAMLLVISLFGSAIVSIILLAFKIVGRKKTIPFVPFILFGYMGVLLFG